MAGSSSLKEDDWEVINDDGFVYKRRKRQRTQEPPIQPEAQPDPVDLQAKLKRRRKKTLKKLRAKYEKELLQWGILSNTLKGMEEKHLEVQQQQRRRGQDQSQPSSCSGSSTVPESSFLPLVDELLLQVEAQEAVIKDVSILCDAAEAICRVVEEESKKPFLDLPIWETPQPQVLLASLCDEDYCNNTDGRCEAYPISSYMQDFPTLEYPLLIFCLRTDKNQNVLDFQFQIQDR